MARFTSRKIFHATGLAGALLMGCQATAAMAAPNEIALIDSQIRDISYHNEGSALVYAGCAAVAQNAYQSDKSIGNALTALATCGAVGCMLTDYYNNCLAVDAQLFLLELRRHELS